MISSIFSPLSVPSTYSKEKKRTDILKSTKGLIVSSKNYIDYTRNYSRTTRFNTFKQPEIDTYPLLKNKDLVSLTRRTFDFSERSRQTYSSLSPNKDQMETISSTKFLITEPRPKKVLTKIDFGDLYQSTKLKQRKHLLRDVLFNEPYYLNMTYDESLIFHKEALYINYIKKKVDEFKYQKSTDFSTEASRSFCNGNVLLKYQSLTIEFLNLTNKRKKPIVFHVPFAYLPLFYFKDFDNIQYILLSVIRFNKEFDEITFDDEAIYSFLKTSSASSLKSSNSNAKTVQIKANQPTQPSPSEEWNWTRQQTHFEEAHRNSLSKKRELLLSPKQVIKAKDKADKKLSILSQYYNTIQRQWITPKYKYQLQIKMPTITLTLPQQKKEIKKTIDSELAIFLLMNNFAHWDFYIANYLVSIKSFRWIIRQTLTKSRLLNFKVNDYLQQRTAEEMMKQIAIRTVKGFEFIDLTKKNIKAPKEEDNSYHFYQTDSKLRNNIFILHNYSVTIQSRSIKANKEFQFAFDFNQMKKLNAVSHCQSLNSFLNKIIQLNARTETITLNYDIFNDLNLDSISKDENIPSFSAKSVAAKEKEFKLTIVTPHLEKIDYIEQLTVKTLSVITDTNESIHKVVLPEVLDELCRSDMGQWAELLCNVRNDTRKKTTTMNMKKEYEREQSISPVHKLSTRRIIFKDSIYLGNSSGRGGSSLRLNYNKSKTIVLKPFKSE